MSSELRTNVDMLNLDSWAISQDDTANTSKTHPLWILKLKHYLLEKPSIEQPQKGLHIINILGLPFISRIPTYC